MTSPRSDGFEDLSDSRSTIIECTGGPDESLPAAIYGLLMVFNLASVVAR